MTPEYNDTNDMRIIDNIPSPSNTERSYLFKEILYGLSVEAKIVCRIIFRCPSELMGIITKTETNHGLTQRSIRKYLRSKGWVIPTIDRAFREIKLRLNELDKL